MARRSDHSRQELELLILTTGHGLMAEGGLSRFSAREVAKRIGYSVGTVMHVYGNFDQLVVAINSRTFTVWAEWLEARLLGAGTENRIDVLIKGYFDFASSHPNLWAAIYEHRLPDGVPIDEEFAEERGRLTGIILREVAAVLPEAPSRDPARIARSLIATVHGHCSFALGGSFALMGEEDPLGLAIARVNEILAANGGAT